MHLGVPVVPEENMMKRGWLKGTCANVSSDSPECPDTKSSNITLEVETGWLVGGESGSRPPTSWVSRPCRCSGSARRRGI